jgi:hypothetical protein
MTPTIVLLVVAAALEVAWHFQLRSRRADLDRYQRHLEVKADGLIFKMASVERAHESAERLLETAAQRLYTVRRWEREENDEPPPSSLETLRRYYRLDAREDEE